LERKKALYFELAKDKAILCNLCPHNCLIKESLTGFCNVRRNIEQDLYSLNYGKIIALVVDPIEKKPFYHFYPGSKTLSIAMPGCNFKCEFCQNSDISQFNDSEDFRFEQLLPEDIVKIAKAKGVKTIAYTYTEPTVFFEFMLETSMIAKSYGLKNVMVTNGFINQKPLEDLLKVVDAFNVDLKSFRSKTYEKFIGGKLDSVLENLETINKSEALLEITSLIIPGVNDTAEEVEDISTFIANLDNNIPWHINKFVPSYKMKDKDETSLDSLKLAYKIAKSKKLNYVYIGNVLDETLSSTFCFKCKTKLITRKGISLFEKNLKDDRCPNCGALIHGCF
jgi:pyruvate formate lyase activating enzyme